MLRTGLSFDQWLFFSNFQNIPDYKLFSMCCDMTFLVDFAGHKMKTLYTTYSLSLSLKKQ